MTIPDLNPLGYTGLKQTTPPNIVYFTKDPISGPGGNIIGFDIGDFWINTSVPQSWQLMKKAGNIPQWELMGSAVSGVFTLTPDIGGVISPFAGNVNVSGGAGIQTSNGGPGILTITEISGGFTWNSVTSATNPNLLIKENGYVPNLAPQVVFILPAAPAFGDSFDIVGTATGNLWTITQNAGQSIRWGNQTTAVGVLGHLDATMVTDSVSLLCVSALTTFEVIYGSGNPSFN